MEQVRERVEGVVGVLGVLEAVEVVHVVAPHDQQEHPGDELEGVRDPVEVPHRRCGAQAHGHVEPQREAVLCVQEGGVMGRLLHSKSCPKTWASSYFSDHVEAVLEVGDVRIAHDLQQVQEDRV